MRRISSLERIEARRRALRERMLRDAERYLDQRLARRGSFSGLRLARARSALPAPDRRPAIPAGPSAV